MRPPLSSVPLLLPVAGFSIGILSGGLFSSPYIAAGIISAVIAVCLYYRFFAGWITAGFAVAGCICHIVSAPSGVFDGNLPEGTAIIGEVRDVQMQQQGNSYIIDLEFLVFKDGLTVDCSGIRITGYVKSFHSNILPGDRIKIRKWSHMHGKLTLLPGDHDSEKSRRRNHITGSIFIAPDQIEVIPGGNRLKRWFFRQREILTDKILCSGLSPPTAHFLIAVLAGNDDFIGESVRELFVSSGMIHILAISGAHIAMISTILGLIFLPLRRIGFRRIYLPLVLACIWFYGLTTGLPYPVLRALVMSSAVMISLLTDRKNVSLNSLLLSALIILTFSPEAIYSLSFLLSFCSIASILLILPVLAPVRNISGLLYRITLAVSLPLAAVIGSGPIILYTTGTFAPYFLLLSYPGQLLVTVLMSGGLVLAGLSYLNIFSPFFCRILDSLYNLLEQLMKGVGSLDYSTVEVAGFPLAAVILLLSLPLLISGWGFNHRKVWIYSILIVLSGTAAVCLLKTDGTAPQEESFILCENHTTYIGSRHSDTLLLLNTDNMTNRREMNLHKFSINHSGYMKRNGIKHLTTMENWSGMVRINGKNIFFLTDSLMPHPDAKINLLVVCRGYTGSPDDAINAFSPDSIILNKDLDIRRYRRYSEQLK